jgi:hypothetical protein
MIVIHQLNFKILVLEFNITVIYIFIFIIIPAFVIFLCMTHSAASGVEIRAAASPVDPGASAAAVQSVVSGS